MYGGARRLRQQVEKIAVGLDEFLRLVLPVPPLVGSTQTPIADVASLGRRQSKHLSEGRPDRDRVCWIADGAEGARRIVDHDATTHREVAGHDRDAGGDALEE